MAIVCIDESEEDNVYNHLDENVKLLDPPAAVRTYKALLDDRQRKAEYQTRLEIKLRTLDVALAQQRDEVESLQRTIRLEREKDSQDAASRRIEWYQKTNKQDERIRDYISDVFYRKAPAHRGKKKNKIVELDTVLISFIRPHDHIRYNLPFRVDRNTTLSVLRDDACKYWDVSTEDFILKTMANSKCQNDIKVNDCFKQGEIAQLRLESKNKEQASVTEAEYKAIAPRSRVRGRRSKEKADLGIDNVMKFNDRWSSTLKKLGGVYFLLKVRDLKPSEHAAKIKPRDFFIYSLLALMTFLVYYFQRLPGEQYWLLRGVENSLFREVEKPPSAFNEALDTSKFVPDFRNLKSHDDVWDWLQISLPHILWRDPSLDDPSLSTYNSLKGYVNIRQKTLLPPDPAYEACDKFKNAIDVLSSDEHFVKKPVCLPDTMSPDNEQMTLGNEDDAHFVGLQRYWEHRLRVDKSADFIRGPALPWEFVSANDNHKLHLIDDTRGHLQVYDAGGFSVEYRADMLKKSTEARQKNLALYALDMQQFRNSSWINQETTLAVFISFTLYNAHYDLWVDIHLNLEFPHSGQVIPSHAIRPYVPNLFENTSDYVLTYVMFFRLLIAGYILVLVGMNEMSHKTRNQKAGFWYYLSLNGLCDVTVTVAIVLTIILRFAWFSSESTGNIMSDLDDVDKTRGYLCHSRWSGRYESLFILEGVIFCFTMFRLVSLFRINRSVYLLWATVGRTLREGAYLAFIFVPAFAYFILAAHRIWGTTSKDFATLHHSFLSVLHLTRGALDVNQMVNLEPVLAMIFYALLYIFVTLLLLAGFSMVFIESYYVVMLTRSRPAENWTANKMKQWLVHPCLLSLYHYAVQEPHAGETE